MARIAVAQLEGVSLYSQSKPHNVEKLNKELADDYEKRTWKERLHLDEKGFVVIPPMAFKNCLSEVAKFLGMQIPGKGKSTFTKHFESGVMVTEPAPLGIHKDDVVGDWIFTPVDGVRGGGKRVYKCYPIIPAGWKTEVTFYIVDDTITESVFAEHLKQAGQLIGIGRFRPRNNGYYGRYLVKNITWKEFE